MSVRYWSFFFGGSTIIIFACYYVNIKVPIIRPVLINVADLIFENSTYNRESSKYTNRKSNSVMKMIGKAVSTLIGRVIQ